MYNVRKVFVVLASTTYCAQVCMENYTIRGVVCMSLYEVINYQMDLGDWTTRYIEGVDAKDLSRGTARPNNMIRASRSTEWYGAVDTASDRYHNLRSELNRG